MNGYDHRPTLASGGSYKVYCGIDFGTHGTGYAFCTPEHPEPQAQPHWGGGTTGWKTPTDILLNSQFQCIGDQGFGANAYNTFMDMEDSTQQRRFYFLRRFKMSLYKGAIVQGDERKEEKVDIEEVIHTRDGRAVKSEMVLVEALRHVIKFIMDKQIRRIFPEVQGMDEVQWVVTVPAIWSQRSRQMMKRAAHQAGIPKTKHDQVIIALEPECASITVAQSEGFEVGEEWMLVDCGGGTVDVACHTLAENGEIVEIHHPTGGPWGSTYIDEEWLQLLRIVFGERVYREMQRVVEEDDPTLIDTLVQNFHTSKDNAVPEEEKRNVNIAAILDILMDVYGSTEAVKSHLENVQYNGAGGISLRRHYLVIPRAVWNVLFSIVVDPIVDHLHSLFRVDTLSGIKKICVVGGFAQSAILISRLQSEFEPLGKTVFVPRDPILAVVSGAATFGLNPDIVRERRAPKTIGIKCTRRFDARTDPRERMFVDRRTLKPMVSGAFLMFVRRNQPIPRRMEPVRYVCTSLNAHGANVDIYQLDDEERIPRFLPDDVERSGRIHLRFPDGYDFERDTIAVTFDFSRALVRVQAQHNDNVPEETEVEWGFD